ncbi:MAG: acyl-CoA dehydrogenase family protein [Caldilineaceae bacterium]|nr:acyl-CoA dehydrogenase family protein [Caldilineaceae bacterium]MBP8107454.1 acyl-CoA dehydrogenase family protein [Caldilineaceae bacterium]MBP8122397.1 acyl-CoA dehydrogenase family protein [Caldilineaceae bacterium]MBP9073553.1 acyl-CoA dehydrogenase family protein [Caldilineaceae bacterium]
MLKFEEETVSGLNFDLPDDLKMLQNLARDFARNEILPRVEHYDVSGEWPWDLWKKALKIGLVNLNIPEEYGGMGATVLEECIIGEEMAYACSGIQTALMLNQLAVLPILVAGNDAQKQQYFPRLTEDGKIMAYCMTEPDAGSDVAGIKTTAIKQGDKYILNGSKTWITDGPVASYFTVYAKTDPSARHKGMSCFIVERDFPGVSTSKPLEKMGQHAAQACQVFFENVEVPAENMLGKEGDGFMIGMRVFDKSRPPTAAAAVGVASRALAESVRYAGERMAYGKPIAQLQGVGFMLADMAIRVEAARNLAWKAAWQVDNGQPNTMVASMAKAYCADAAMQNATDAVQVFGGNGYSREYPVEKLMRDAKIYQIYEGTSQVMRHILMRELYKG